MSVRLGQPCPVVRSPRTPSIATVHDSSSPTNRSCRRRPGSRSSTHHAVVPVHRAHLKPRLAQVARARGPRSQHIIHRATPWERGRPFVRPSRRRAGSGPPWERGRPARKRATGPPHGQAGDAHALGLLQRQSSAVHPRPTSTALGASGGGVAGSGVSLLSALCGPSARCGQDARAPRGRAGGRASGGATLSGVDIAPRGAGGDGGLLSRRAVRRGCQAERRPQ